MEAENPSGPGNTPDDSGGQQPKKPAPDAYSEQFQHNPVSARVPEKWSNGVLSTGVLVLDSPTEFVMDFMQGLTRPYKIAARVVITPQIMQQFIATVQDNLGKYVQSFGPPPTLPKGSTNNRPTIQEIYDNFKLPEDQMSGSYANSVMMGHTPTEFFFDFITGFYPTAAVSARIYMSAPQVPRMLETLQMAVQQYQRRFGPRQEPPAPAAGPE